MEFEMNEEARTIRVYNLRADTREFIGEGDAYIPPFTGLPADCTSIAPPKTTKGKVAVFSDESQSWSLVEDHRGETVYSTETGESFLILELGPLPDIFTKKTPAGEFQKWNGKAWVKDVEAEQSAMHEAAISTKASLLARASEQISLFQDAIDLGMATEKESILLTEWKKYRVLLSRVEITGDDEIIWPEEPDNVA